MTEPSVDDDVISTLSDYLDGALTADQRRDVEAKLANDETWKRAHAELVETRKALSGLQKARAPAKFDKNVTSTIHQRSGGRFFGLGDRVPFRVLLVIALVVLIPIAYVLWASQTGSLKRDHEPVPSVGSQSVIKKP